MAIFVADASVALAWCLQDEATAWTDQLLDGLRNGDRIEVPAHWPTEMSNGLLMAARRKRIQPGDPQRFWDQLASLPIVVEPPLSPDQAKTVLDLCELHNLTAYDAAYLELARRKGWSLATQDSDLLRAAPREGVLLAARHP
ncbi:MAG: type II toxin-antitoxin system VapC family toxin [Terracidiphilus sp.]